MQLKQQWKDELLQLVNTKNSLSLTETDVAFVISNRDAESGALAVTCQPAEGSAYFNEQTLTYVPRDLAKNFLGIPLRFVVSNDTNVGAIVDQLAARYGVALDKAVDFLEDLLNQPISFAESGQVNVDLDVADSSFVWVGKLTVTVANDTLDLVTIIEQADLTSLHYIAGDAEKGSVSLATYPLDWSAEATQFGVADLAVGALPPEGLPQAVVDRLVAEGVIADDQAPQVRTVFAASPLAEFINNGVSTVARFGPSQAASPEWAGDTYLHYAPVAVSYQDMTFKVGPGALSLTVSGPGNPNPTAWYRLKSDGVKVDLVNGKVSTTIADDDEVELGWDANAAIFSVTVSGVALLEVTDFGSRNNVGRYDFRYSSNLTKVPATLPSSVTSLSSMFTSCSAFNDPSIGAWDVSNVTLLDYAFRNASSFNQDLSGWDVSAVTTHDGFDSGATAWEAGNKPSWDVAFDPSTLDDSENIVLKTGNTGDAVQILITGTPAWYKLNGAEAVAIPEGEEATVNHEQGVNNYIEIGLMQNAENVSVMLKGGLVEVMKFAVSGVAHYNFNGSSVLEVPAALPADVTNMDYMFLNCATFNSANVVTWDVSNVTSMNQTFSGAGWFNQDLSGWNVSNVTSHNDFDFTAFGWDAEKKPVFA